jgi:cytochrome c556
MPEVSFDVEYVKAAIANIQQSAQDLSYVSSTVRGSASDLPRETIPINDQGISQAYQDLRKEAEDYASKLARGLSAMVNTLNQVVAQYRNTDSENAGGLSSINGQL